MNRNDDRWSGDNADDGRWGGVRYGRREQMDPDRMWQGDSPRDRDYGMVGSWRERRHENERQGFEDTRGLSQPRRWDIDDRFNLGQDTHLRQGGFRDGGRREGAIDHREHTAEDRQRWASGNWQRHGQADFGQPGGSGLYAGNYDPDRYPTGHRGQGQRYDTGHYDMGRQDTGRYDMGRSDMGRHDMGRQDMGRHGPHAGKGPRGYQRNYERVKENVCDALERDGFVDASNIDVRCDNGEIVLTGTVTDRMQKRRAEHIAEQIDGVRDVHNQLRVQSEARQDHGGQNETVVPSLSNTQASGRTAST